VALIVEVFWFFLFFGTVSEDFFPFGFFFLSSLFVAVVFPSFPSLF